jgi:hypothetical protein
MFSKGKKAVQSMYEAAKMGQQIKPQLLQMTSKQDFVDAAKQLLDMGQLNPTEALAARKTLDQMKNKMAGEAYRDLRTKFDGVAKQLFQGSDEAYQDALNAEALRNLFPQNKSGGASPFKAAMALFEIGLTPLISPAIQGTAATGMGLANRYAIQPMLSNPMGALGIGAGIVNQGNQ